MSGSVIEIFLDDAQPGMVLSDALLDRDGGVLLPRGATLTEAMLRSLERRGVDKLIVINAGMSEAEREAEHARMHQRLDRLFRKSTGDDARGMLQQHLLHYRLDDVP